MTKPREWNGNMLRNLVVLVPLGAHRTMAEFIAVIAFSFRSFERLQPLHR